MGMSTLNEDQILRHPDGRLTTLDGRSPVTRCTFCEEKFTFMMGTKLCDRCWELKRRVEMDPELARKALEQLEQR